VSYLLDITPTTLVLLACKYLLKKYYILLSFSGGSILFSMLQCTIPPLNQRIFRSGRTFSGPHHEDTSQRPSKLKQWSAQSMDKAINAILNEGLSIRRAAEHHAIPQSLPWVTG